MSKLTVLRVATSGYGVQVFVDNDVNLRKLKSLGESIVKHLKGLEQREIEVENSHVQLTSDGDPYIHVELTYGSNQRKAREHLIELLNPQYVLNGSAEVTVERDNTGRHVATLVTLEVSESLPDGALDTVQSVDGVLRAVNSSYGGGLRFSVTDPANEDEVRDTVAQVAKSLKVKLRTKPSELKFHDDTTSPLIPGRDYDEAYAGNGSKVLA